MAYKFKKKCPVCKKVFKAKSEKNIYCCRSHFKRAWYHRMKGQELKDAKKFPVFLCPLCGNLITLNFDPVKKSNKWLHFHCPGCNFLMINVSDMIVTQDVSAT